MKALLVPGVSVAVFDSGRIIWARGYGQRDKQLSQPVDTGTLFQAASISKPVTTVGMFTLVEKKSISLDEDVNLILKRWKVPDNAFTDTQKVTPRRIVSHMAGLTVHGFAGYNPTAPLPDLPDILNGAPPANSPPVRVEAVPGTREIYSGGGFTVLQSLIEDVTGQPFATFEKDHVLTPAGMTQSTSEQPLPGYLIPIASKGYHANGDMVDGGYHVYPERAAAGLWTTPSDYARFLLSIDRSYRGEPGLLQQATVREMLIKVPGGGGLGFGIDGSGDSFRIRHNGQNAGFSCYAVSFPQFGRGVVIMTNTDQGDELIHELIHAIAREYHWLPMWPKE